MRLAAQLTSFALLGSVPAVAQAQDADRNAVLGVLKSYTAALLQKDPAGMATHARH